MKINKNVDVPQIRRGNTVYSELYGEVVKFIGNDDEFTMNIECDDTKQGRRVYSALQSRCRNAKLPVKVWSRGADVYFTKEKKNV